MSIIFKQQRIGRHGRPFTLYKLRTMVDGAEELSEEVLSASGQSFGQPIDDPRVTRFGRFLRRYYIDELPQIWNIIKGDMTLIGPRPTRESYLQHYPGDIQMDRQRYKPGLFAASYAWYDPGEGHYPEAIFAAERAYLRRKERHPFSTDITCLMKITYKILFEGFRGL
jgi:lipopolysaccharide/colanic/teichoic acid biosynthesis glycosyltransferase